eukprot:TRINITY_DN2233_c0_g2_i2.p1 TRINITY_DN2233_c0_g2~~TRINITY_DN2233_c0_g2_i2.p1  ORF type:complete len:306 (-),score=35.18 TRINITY_DN2233_c0_g2_i2:59-976(-)
MIGGLSFPENDRDVWIAESKDSGSNWTAMRKVPRRTMNDGCHRYSPQLIYSKEISRVFIFYHVSCENTNEIRLITKYAYDSVFSAEKVAWKSSQHFEKVHATYTLKFGVPILHLFSVHNGLYHMLSATNGDTWTVLNRIGKKQFSQIAIASDVDKDKRIFVYAQDEKGITLLTSGDQGQTYLEQEIKSDFTWTETPAFIVCSDNTDTKLVALEVQEHKMRYMFYDVKTSKLSIEPLPFEDPLHYYGFSLSCGREGIVSENPNTVTAIVGGSYFAETSWLMISNDPMNRPTLQMLTNIERLSLIHI